MSFSNQASVIIPTYNRLSSLDKLLESLRVQSVSPLEIIVCDNNSGVSYEELLMKYSSLPIRFEVCFKKGPAAVRNFGAKVSKGKFLVFVDDDVICAEDWLENILKPFECDENIDCVGGKIESFPSYDTVSQKWAYLCRILNNFVEYAKK